MTLRSSESGGNAIMADRIRVSRPHSDLLLTTIDEQLDAIHEARIVRGEEQRSAGDFAGFAKTSHGNLRSQVVSEALTLRGVVTGQIEQAWRAGCAGADRVHADLTVLEVENPVACERAHRGLRSRIN